jgi:hypothetical protein
VTQALSLPPAAAALLLGVETSLAEIRAALGAQSGFFRLFLPRRPKTPSFLGPNAVQTRLQIMAGAAHAHPPNTTYPGMESESGHQKDDQEEDDDPEDRHQATS